MRKILFLLALFALAQAALSEQYDYVTTNKIFDLDIEYRWRYDLDFSKSTAVLMGVTPNLFGEVEIPSAIVLKGPGVQAVLAVTELADGALANHNAITSVTLPGGMLKRIGTACFSNCTALAEVTISYGVTTIGARAFMGTIIQQLDLPDSVLNLEGNIAMGAHFDLANSLKDSSHFLVTKDGAVYNRDQTRLYSCPTRQEGTLVMPESLLEILPDAFYGCFRLTYLDIPATVTSIGAGAFNVTGDWTLDEAPESAPKLSKVFFSSHLPPATDATAFDGAPADPPGDTLVYVTAEDASAWEPTIAGRNVTLINGSSPPELSYVDSYNVTWKYRVVDNEAELITIEPKTTSGHAIYESEESIHSRNALEVPASINGFPLTRIGTNAFENCNALVYLALPETLTSIGDCAFKGCKHLKAIGLPENIPWDTADNTFTLPSGVTRLGRHVFEGTTAIEICLPHTLSEMDGNPVAGATYVSSVTIDQSNPNFIVENEIIFDRTKSCVFGMPANAQVSNLTIPNSVKSLANEALFGSKILQNLTLPASVRHLGTNALANCQNLVSVVICGDEPIADDSLYEGSNADLVTTCTEGFAGWSGDTWHGRKLVINRNGPDNPGPDGPSTVTQVVDGVAFQAQILPAGLKITSIEGYGPLLTIPRTLGNMLVTAIDDSVLQALEGVSRFASETPEIVARNGCLYTPDYSTLLRVPDAYEFTHLVTVTNLTCRRTVTSETYVHDGQVEYVSKVTSDITETMGSVVSEFTVDGTASIDDLLPASVTAIGPFAFHGCLGAGSTTHVITNGSPSVSIKADTTDGAKTIQTVSTDYTVTTSNHTFLAQMPAHVTRISTTAFDENAASLGVNTVDDPVIGGYYQTPAAVFNFASTKSPIVYPTPPVLSGDAGSQTIAFRGVNVSVPDYYTATHEGCQITLELNDNARSEPTSLVVGEDAISFVLSNVRPELYYAVKSQDTLGGDWKYVSNARRGAELDSKKVELTLKGRSGFYTVVVTDTMP